MRADYAQPFPAREQAGCPYLVPGPPPGSVPLAAFMCMCQINSAATATPTVATLTPHTVQTCPVLWDICICSELCGVLRGMFSFLRFRTRR
jgi:hypothetical protein